MTAHTSTIRPRSPADLARRMADADRWQKRAEECRTLAGTFHDSYCIMSLHVTARGYDRMVQHAKERQS